MSSTSPSGFSQAEHNTTGSAWLACGVIIAGSIVGGIALIEWIWPLFWVGIAMMVGGSIFGWAVGIMNQVSEFALPQNSPTPAADDRAGSGRSDVGEDHYEQDR